MVFLAVSRVNAVLLITAMVLLSAMTLSMVWGPSAVANVPYTTAGLMIDVPRSGLAIGPINVNSVPVYVYNCLAAVSHQKSPTDNPLGADALASAPPAVLNLAPS